MPFCQLGSGGTGYVMENWFMPSFSKNATCILLWFSGWTIDNEGKYAAAIIGVFVMGVLVGYFPYVHYALSLRPARRGYRVLRTMLYGLQMTFAYLLMLATMLYETFIFMAVICGLMTGYFLNLEMLDKSAAGLSSHNPKSLPRENKSNGGAEKGGDITSSTSVGNVQRSHEDEDNEDRPPREDEPFLQLPMPKSGVPYGSPCCGCSSPLPPRTVH
eukprot:PhF_6_TR12881/c0_g1_i3/m.20261